MRIAITVPSSSRTMSTPRPVTTISTTNHNPLAVRVTDTSLHRNDWAENKAGSRIDEHTSEPVMNPDLPTRDALYIFANFSSYTRTPKQGSQGVRDEQLKHASRLLDFARVCFICTTRKRAILPT